MPLHSLETVGCCPVCGDVRRNTLYRDLPDRLHVIAGTWSMYRCSGCGSSYLDPRLTSAAIGLAYREYFTHEPSTGPAGFGRSDRKAAMRNGYLNSRFGSRLHPASSLGAVLVGLLYPLRIKAERHFRHLPPPPPAGRLLDVGCGNGEFLAEMEKLGWQTQGLEVDPVAAGIALQRGIPTVNGPLEEETFPPEWFDAITLHHVIEHLPQPREVVRICHRILRPGGTLSITTPNLDSYGHRTFGRDWFPLEVPRHLVLFNRSSLENALRDAGFSRIDSPASTLMNAAIYRTSINYAHERTSGSWAATPQMRIRLKLAQAAAWFFPGLAEEIVVVARKHSPA